MLSPCGFYLLSRHLESNLLDLMRCCNPLILLAPSPPPPSLSLQMLLEGSEYQSGCQAAAKLPEVKILPWGGEKNYCSRLIIGFDLANNWEEKGQLPNLCFRLWFGGYGRETSTLNRVVRILALLRQISWLMLAVQFWILVHLKKNVLAEGASNFYFRN